MSAGHCPGAWYRARYRPTYPQRVPPVRGRRDADPVRPRRHAATCWTPPDGTRTVAPGGPRADGPGCRYPIGNRFAARYGPGL